jgi:CheY-like chemotaxis protein
MTVASESGAKDVLIVQGDRELAELLQALLQSADFSVSIASDAFDAVHQVRCRQPACILLDLHLHSAMPRGLELCGTLKCVHRTSARMIALTGNLQISESWLVAAGFDGVVYKPVDFERLLRLMIRVPISRFMAKYTS